MIRNAWFKKTVASALLMSAVAAPAVTNAAASEQPEVPSDVPAKVAAIPAIKGAVIKSAIADPLELAQKYAPDTVEDWKQTLEKFKKVAGEGPRFFSVIKAVPVEEAAKVKAGEASPVTETLQPAAAIPGEEIRIEILDKLKDKAAEVLGQAKDLELAVPGQIKVFDKADVPGQILELDKAEVLGQIKVLVKSEAAEQAKPVDEAKALGPAKVIISKLGDLKVEAAKTEPAAAGDSEHSKTVSIAVSKEASESAIAFMKAHIALHDAVESKDEAAIKDALAKLLVQYKAQIKELEAAAQS
ncbi:hypothetical protein M3647_21745 [Paenibacillus cellulositrophicus]|uniref:hypothetical protein n=1 Tax=Paenibacillus cellulositrophicus TaxID=562959 RepID=UPI00203C88DF|nr:hypothetical protein [Paenibacillus cellulositrophicus]MCM3000101.1 hypothetical protein [Paenibacillus cellulositrophicus]